MNNILNFIWLQHNSIYKNHYNYTQNFEKIPTIPSTTNQKFKFHPILILSIELISTNINGDKTLRFAVRVLRAKTPTPEPRIFRGRVMIYSPTGSLTFCCGIFEFDIWNYLVVCCVYFPEKRIFSRNTARDGFTF